LLVGAEGKLSKRLGAMGIADLRAGGIEPEAIIALLARLGTSDPVDAALGREKLVAGFDLARFGRAPARFDEEELARVNAAIIHHMPFAQVAARLPEGVSEGWWEAIRPNIRSLAEVAAIWQRLSHPSAYQPLPEDAAYIGLAAQRLAALPWEDGIWQVLTGALKDGTGRKGKALFQPLRLALTGEPHGPEMAALLPLIGRDEALRRLRAAAAGNLARGA